MKKYVYEDSVRVDYDFICDWCGNKISNGKIVYLLEDEEANVEAVCKDCKKGKALR